MKKFIPFLISGILAIGTFGCQSEEAAKTNPEASDTTEATQPAAQEASDITAETKAKEDVAATEGEATTDTAASDLKIDPSATDSATDPAAAEGVTDPTAAGAAEDATAVDGDVATQANKALKDKLPTSKLEAKEEGTGVVSVSGTVSSDAELEEIEPTVKSVQGVTEVKVNATVEAAPAE
ncbi:BON domain-containing protein [Mastigocoleus sp. MO_188.B34]|uniref:BON domain-containing protein n=1 Tax=Mastigocoleus sp. MO_188.B34 TaxID=3036635 RepID=UPI00262A7A83|nr:BON domain-containing protein [Mastigocoleus sp. MO_188.B34]MDJ0692999.1 BON domain-containing protein [Mastigocoleus sp. MO_188.B34]